MSAQVAITQLPTAGAITGTEAVPIVQNGVTVQTTTAAISASPSQTQTFLTKNQEATLPNSRYLSTTTGLTLTDGGAQSFYRIAMDGAAASLNAASNGVVVKNSSGTVVNRSIAVSGSGLGVSNADGVSGDPTLALTGIAASIAALSGTGLLALTGGGTSISGRTLAGTASQIDIANADGAASAPSFSIADNAVLPGTGGVVVPAGTTGQRGTSSLGNFRYNTTTNLFEGYNGTWNSFAVAITVSSISFGTTGLTPATATTGAVTVAGTLAVANGGTGVTTSTGTTNVVLSNSPTLVTPALGTPSALVGTNITGTAAGLTAGTVTTNANLTGAVTSVGNASSLGSFTSAQLAGALTDETGTGVAVFGTSPAITTSLTTGSTSFNLLNTTATTLNFGGAATAVNIGAATGTMTVANTTLAAKAITASTTLGVTGVATFAAGTAALPAITTTGGTNTGVFFPSVSSLALSTGGSERVRVISTGEVGIGATPTTAAKTSIVSTSAGASTIALSLQNASDTINSETVLDFVTNTAGAGIRSAQITAINTNGSTGLNMVFKISNGDLPAEAMRIVSNRGLQLTRGVGVSNTTPEASGVSFPATAVAVADSNTLDDYEEGSWTPVVTFTGGNGDLTTSEALGVYTKIGRLVQIAFNVEFSETTALTNLTITGVPFTSGSTVRPFVGCWVDNMTALVGSPVAGLGVATTTIILYTTGTGGAANITNVNTGTSSRVRGSLSYSI